MMQLQPGISGARKHLLRQPNGSITVIHACHQNSLVQDVSNGTGKHKQAFWELQCHCTGNNERNQVLEKGIDHSYLTVNISTNA